MNADTLDRFRTFKAQHGPLESGLTDRILGDFFTFFINRAFEMSRQGSSRDSIGDQVAKMLAAHAPDVLAVVELAAQWGADPMKAAESQLRPELEAKAQAEAAARKRHEEAQLRAAINAKAEAFAKEALSKLNA